MEKSDIPCRRFKKFGLRLGVWTILSVDDIIPFSRNEFFFLWVLCKIDFVAGSSGLLLMRWDDITWIHAPNHNSGGGNYFPFSVARCSHANLPLGRKEDVLFLFLPAERMSSDPLEVRTLTVMSVRMCSRIRQLCSNRGATNQQLRYR